MEEKIKTIKEEKAEGRCFPIAKIKEMLREMEAKDLRVSHAAKLFGVHSGTISRWVRQYTPEKSKPFKKHKSELEKKSIVRDVQSGFLTLNEAASKHNVLERTIKEWMELYSYQIPITDMKEKETPSLTQKDRKIEELELKVLALETMIDVAEKTLKVDIRKKSGTKQSLK